MRRGKRYFYQSFGEEKTAVAGFDTLVDDIVLVVGVSGWLLVFCEISLLEMFQCFSVSMQI